MTKSEKTDNMAFAFHACLRKYMDSKASSICWLSIGLLSADVWTNFINRLYEKEISLENCLEAIRITRDDRNNGIDRTADVILFKIGLEMLEEKEWEALRDCIKQCY